jgi:hypothetical protein
VTDPISDWLEKMGEPVTREAWIDVNWMGEPPDPWTAEDEAQLPEELQRKEVAARDTGEVYLHVHQGDAWEEREHPRKTKGPGGGEFTVKGSGSFGGGPTIHVHEPVAWKPPPPQHAPEVKTPEQSLAEYHERQREGFETLNKTPEERRKLEAQRAQTSFEERIAKHAAEHRVFEQAVTAPKGELKRAGYKVQEVPKEARGWLGADDTPPKSGARMMAGAYGYDAAVRTLNAKGLTGLASHIKNEIGVTMSSLIARGGIINLSGKDVLDDGTIMETVTNGADEFVLINANSKPSQEQPVHERSPLLAVELSEMKGKHTPEEITGYEMTAAAIHEFGHVLDNWSKGGMTASLGKQLERWLTPTWGENWARHADGWLRNNISGYAASKPQEATAEAFYLMTTRGVDALPAPLRTWGQYWLDRAKAETMPKPKQIMADWE